MSDQSWIHGKLTIPYALLIAIALIVAVGPTIRSGAESDSEFMYGQFFRFQMKSDAMSDQTTCTLVLGDPDRTRISVFGSRPSVALLSGKSSFSPRKAGLLRVDKNAPIPLRYVDQEGGILMPEREATAAFIKQVAVGEKLIVRYVQWPAGTTTDRSYDIVPWRYIIYSAFRRCPHWNNRERPSDPQLELVERQTIDWETIDYRGAKIPVFMTGRAWQLLVRGEQCKLGVAHLNPLESAAFEGRGQSLAIPKPLTASSYALRVFNDEFRVVHQDGAAVEAARAAWDASPSGYLRYSHRGARSLVGFRNVYAKAVEICAWPSFPE